MFDLAQIAMILIAVAIAVAGVAMIATGNIPPCGC